MAMRWSYIGALGDGGVLEQGGGEYDNTPVSGQFLPDWDDTAFYLRIRFHAREGRYHGKQLDWGSFAIKVNGPELLNVIEESNPDWAEWPEDHLIHQYVSFARELGTDAYVALVSCEM